MVSGMFSGRTPTRVFAAAALIAAVGACSDSTGPGRNDDRWAFAWLSTTDAGPVKLDPTYSYTTDSSGDSITSTRIGTGNYVVRFPGMGRRSGWKENVQIAGYGSTHTRCTIVSSESVDEDLVANVRCFNTAGDAANLQFTTLVASAGRLNGRSAFAVSNSAAGSLKASDSYNPTGKPITISRASTGVYSVKFEGLDRPDVLADRETILVSTLGSESNFCSVSFWSDASTGEAGTVVEVNCFNSAGALADARFSVLMMANELRDGGSRLGFAWSGTPPVSGVFNPSSTYQYNSAGEVFTANQTATGRTVFALPGLGRVLPGATETMLVTSYSTTGASCQIASWGSVSATVYCFTAAGAAVSSAFNILRID